MAPKYKLIYFDILADVVDPICFLLAYGKVDFEEKRISISDWPMEEYPPWAPMPILDVDGRRSWDHMTLCWDLGRKFGLAGSNGEEDMQIGRAVRSVAYLRETIQEYFYEPDKTRKMEKKEILFYEYFPYSLPKMENLVKENAGYLAAGKLTWADLYYASMGDYFNAMAGTDILRKYPNFAALNKKVLEIPAIKEYIKKKRPYIEL